MITEEQTLLDKTGVRYKKHPTLNIYCLEDGRILMPRSRYTGAPRITNGCLNKKNYYVVQVAGKQYRVHILIAETFLKNPLGYPTVDHINRITTDNRVSNLQFADMSMQSNNRINVINRLQLGVRQSEDCDEYTNRWRDYAKQHIYMWSEVRKWRNRHRDWVSQHWAEVQAHSKEFHGRRVREY